MKLRAHIHKEQVTIEGKDYVSNQISDAILKQSLSPKRNCHKKNVRLIGFYDMIFCFRIVRLKNAYFVFPDSPVKSNLDSIF